MMYSRHRAVSTGSRLLLVPFRGIHPAEENTRTAAVSTSACATWMARHAVRARHHQRAAHAVCGRAWAARASGAAAVSSTSAISRRT